MIASRAVCRAAARIKREYGTGDPFALARELRIEVLVRELGTLKGFYKDVYGTPFIFLSRRLTRGLRARAGASSAAPAICGVRL